MPSITVRAILLCVSGLAGDANIAGRQGLLPAALDLPVRDVPLWESVGCPTTLIFCERGSGITAGGGATWLYGTALVGRPSIRFWPIAPRQHLLPAYGGVSTGC